MNNIFIRDKSRLTWFFSKNGSCMIGKYRVCRDGPVFNAAQLREVQEEQGISKLGFNGSRIPLRGGRSVLAKNQRISMLKNSAYLGIDKRKEKEVYSSSDGSPIFRM
jgi:hypothetical protein